MIHSLSISGTWQFLDDQEEQYTGFPPEAEAFHDTILLPGTTSLAKKGKENPKRETGHLTEVYPYSGTAWFRRNVTIPQNFRGRKMQLFLERTRITRVWVNGDDLGTRNSLCTPHCYDLSAYSNAESITIVIAVNNTHYPIPGGHMTSQDTQTNWNGIIGEMALQFFDTCSIISVKANPKASNRTLTLALKTSGTINMIKVVGKWIRYGEPDEAMPQQILPVLHAADGSFYLKVLLPENAPLWDEYNPVLGKLSLYPYGSDDMTEVIFGLTAFQINKMDFTNHGRKVFLRGKHDAMLFPLTGAAPTNVFEWAKVFLTAKEYGINHYRFHTCCPPEAAFIAADLIGIYLEPEIPFWGTLHSPGEEDYNAEQQAYIAEEGRRILETYGNHPSFAMFSLGNELWGSPERFGKLLRYLKSNESRILFTQGSNNSQFSPAIVPEEDFFVGVRMDRNRLIRGSYASCDRPFGHVQSERPSTMHSYEKAILPDQAALQKSNPLEEVEVQYGTGVRKVKVASASSGILPDRPVISHEIGQYCMFPDFREIEKYTGVLQARNFKIFRERLTRMHMEGQADAFLRCSGKLAVKCYKEEIESAMRSDNLSGFQLLDLQDFSGQGTATVGILNAFMESKGLIEPAKWREFCSDSVLLAQFPEYVLTEDFHAEIKLRHYAPFPVEGAVRYSIQRGTKILNEGELTLSVHGQGLFKVGTISCKLPSASRVHKVSLTLSLPHTQNSYKLWQFPVQEMPALQETKTLCVTTSFEEASSALAKGKRVLFFPETLRKSVTGTYCPDFWCYPMFRKICEEMKLPEPAGTLGLCIQKVHPALDHFRCEEWATPQWYDLVEGTDCAILDDLPIQPIVQMIDNVERCHKLGLLFECCVDNGKLLVCTMHPEKLPDRPEAKQFLKSLLHYASSSLFLPTASLSFPQLLTLFE